MQTGRQQLNRRFEEIYGEYYGKVYNYCLRMVSDRETAGDLTQDIFTRVYQNLDAFEGRSSLSTWIYSIAGNCCMDHFRKRKSFFNTISQLFHQVTDR